MKVYENENMTYAKFDVEWNVYIFFVDGMLIDTGPKRVKNDGIAFYENYSFDIVAT